MRRCASCGSPAAIYQHHAGRFLCWRCFEEDVVGRARRELSRWGLLSPGDRLLLALSGGKDSYTLLHVMARIHDTSKMAVVTVYEGGPGSWRRLEAEPIHREARRLGVDVLTVSFEEAYGAPLREMVERARRRGLGLKPCTVCGVLRRRLLDDTARAHGFTKLATAHNLDDEAQTAIMNILRGDVVGLIRQHPLAALQGVGDFTPRIKPLRRVHEYETAAYAYMKGYGPPAHECPYLGERPTLRLMVRLRLYRIQWLEDPAAAWRLIDSLDALLAGEAEKLGSLPPLPRCRLCGRPTSYGREVCKACEILIKLGLA